MGRNNGMETAYWDHKQLFSVQEAAEFLGLSVSTIRRYIYDRRLPAYKVAGERAVRIKRDDLQTLLEPMFEDNHQASES